MDFPATLRVRREAHNRLPRCRSQWNEADRLRAIQRIAMPSESQATGAEHPNAARHGSAPARCEIAQFPEQISCQILDGPERRDRFRHPGRAQGKLNRDRWLAFLRTESKC